MESNVNLIDKNKIVTTCKRLPISIDPIRLKEEIYAIPPELWNETRSPVHQDVDAVFIKGYPPVQRKADDVREVMKQLPYLHEIIYDLIPGKSPLKCVAVKLNPNGYVRIHRDGWVDAPDNSNADLYFYNYFNSSIRIHIPVVTSQEAIFFCNGTFFHMPAGEVWAVNNINDHAVINDNPSLERTHIIVDIDPDETLLNMVASTPQAEGWHDEEAVKRLMEDSSAPPISPYAAEKLT